MFRKPIPSKTEQEVLLKSRRRCALCWGLEQDLGVKQVQIAHIDRDSAHDAATNLAALCLTHHDQYDTTPRQTKKLTPDELMVYRDELYDILEQKRRKVMAANIELGNKSVPGATNAERLGLLVEAFDEDISRDKPNGLRLAHLANQLIQREGDFAAAGEAIRCLLRLIQNGDSDSFSFATSFLLRQNVLPVASPVVSLARALLSCASVDGEFLLRLVELVTSSAFSGEVRGFAGRTIHDVPMAHTPEIFSALCGILNGILGPTEDWVIEVILRAVSGLFSRITIAYALQGCEFPSTIDRIYQGHHGRVAPGPGFIGDVDPADWEGKKFPPDLWFSCLHAVARLNSKQLTAIISQLPPSLPDHRFIFGIAKSEAVSFETARHLGDFWTTIWSGVMLTKMIRVADQEQLELVQAHVETQRAKAEASLADLRRCLECEHRIIWGTPKSSQ